MKKELRDFFLTPPEIPFCIAFILFAMLMASLMTYFSVDFAEGYSKAKDTLQNGQLIEAEFKEVGRQRHVKGHTYGDGYSYYAIYEYYDNNGNRYKTETARAFRSSQEVLEYVETHPTKSLYIDGNGYSISGDENLSKYTVKGVLMGLAAALFYAVIVIVSIQLVRRIKMNKEKKKAQKQEIT